MGQHITCEQRYTIECLLKQNKTQKEIAQTIGKDKSVISREIQRNADGRSKVYRSKLAIKKCAERHKKKRKRIRFTDTMRQEVEALLRIDYSPEQVQGVRQKEQQDCVSIERIYQHIWRDKKQGGNLYQHLRRRSKRYRKRGNKKDTRGSIPDRVSIEQRPAIVDEKKRFGDIEVDLVIGKNHKQALVTANDKTTGMLKVRKVSSKRSKEVEDAIVDMLREWRDNLHTITSDNGKEFSNHLSIAERLDIDFFFCRPYHSWERGSNENLNGLIRQYIPKNKDFTTLTDQYIQEVEDKLNQRPRKRFNFENPIHMMNQLLL